MYTRLFGCININELEELFLKAMGNNCRIIEPNALIVVEENLEPKHLTKEYMFENATETGGEGDNELFFFEVSDVVDFLYSQNLLNDLEDYSDDYPNSFIVFMT